MLYKDDIVVGLWRYVETRNDLFVALDRAQASRRPPVFTLENADLNVIRASDARPEQQAELLGAIPRRNRHRWFRSMASSQALAQSLFGNLDLYDQISVLGDIEPDTGEPLVGVPPEAIKLEFEVNYLGEPRKTSLDVLVSCSNGYRVSFECKLAEPGIGKCSRPTLRPREPNYERDRCNGTYTHQCDRKVRCSLTNIGVAYWKYIPHLFHWSSEQDHKPCPLRESYQIVRNILAVCVDESRALNLGKGHSVLVYDERNPAFRPNGAGYAAYDRTHAALCQKSLLRKCSWQTIVQHLRRTGTLKWLVDELVAKYGL